MSRHKGIGNAGLGFYRGQYALPEFLVLKKRVDWQQLENVKQTNKQTIRWLVMFQWLRLNLQQSPSSFPPFHQMLETDYRNGSITEVPH